MTEANQGITWAMRLSDVFDGADIATLKDWRSKLRVLLSLHAPEVPSLVDGKWPPADNATAAEKQARIKAQMELFSPPAYSIRAKGMRI